MMVLLLVLVLCFRSSTAQDLLSPNVDIIAELEKIKIMDRRMQTLEESLSKVLSENEALKMSVHESQNKMEPFQKENEELKISMQEAQNMMEYFRKENEELKISMQEAQNKMETFRKEIEAQKIAFSVGLQTSESRHTGPFATRKTLIYKKVFSNVGNAYDSNTGIFTAPMKGVYFFRFYAHCQSGVTSAVSLMKNGEVQCSVHEWKPAANGNASNGAVLNLEAGDQVHTELWKDSRVYDDAASYTSFSGFLLFPL